LEISRLTKASLEDAFLFGSIAKKAKAHWGYPAEWLALWEDDLSFTKDFLSMHFVLVLKLADQIRGFFIIIEEPDHFNIEHCWVLPEHLGKGHGSQLLRRALSEPYFANQKIQVLSDPNAVGFYEKFGFKTTQMIPSKPIGREPPLMQMINIGR